MALAFVPFYRRRGLARRFDGFPAHCRGLVVFGICWAFERRDSTVAAIRQRGLPAAIHALSSELSSAAVSDMAGLEASRCGRDSILGYLRSLRIKNRLYALVLGRWWGSLEPLVSADVRGSSNAAGVWSPARFLFAGSRWLSGAPRCSSLHGTLCWYCCHWCLGALDRFAQRVKRSADKKKPPAAGGAAGGQFKKVCRLGGRGDLLGLTRE